MIDIHSHIVFSVDDGPETVEDSLALLRSSYDQGVRTVVSTSHRRKGMFETEESVIKARFEEVKKLAEKELPNLTLLYGAEIYYTEDILDKLEEKEIPTLGDSQFALIEFSARTPYKEMYTGLTSILRLGVTPVIAHIERYHCLDEKLSRLKELIELGCLTQVNSSHVLKARLFGDKNKPMKKRVQNYLKQDLVHFVASDMHSMGERPSYMKEAYHIVQKEYGQERAAKLFENNQELLLKNEFF